MQQISASNLHILLVEPSQVQRKIIVQLLEEEEVRAIDTAGSIKEAMALINKIRPDLVISSLHLPDGSAEELLKAIRQQPKLADLPFMLVSSENRRWHLEVFKQSGAVAILPKPFTRQHLGAAINATLDLLSPDELELENYNVDDLRVLVVDDSRMARKMIQKVLGNLGIRFMTEAHDGSEAIKILERENIDLVVTDYNMPEVNGLQLTEFIRNSSYHAHIPILMVTSEANEAHLSNINQSGVNAMVDKPFEPETVKKLLQRILD